MAATTLPRVLTDGFVVLDQPSPADAPLMLAAAVEPSTRRPFGETLPKTLDQAIEAVSAARMLWAEQGEDFDGRYVVRRAGDPAFAGWLRLHAEGEAVRVLAWFGSQRRGQGLGTAAIRLACGFAFDDLRQRLWLTSHRTTGRPGRSSAASGFAQRPRGGFTTSADSSGMALKYHLSRCEWPPKDDLATESDMRGELADAERELAKHDEDPDGDLPIGALPGPRGELVRKYCYIQRRSEHEDRVERARQRIRRAGLPDA